jgi:hypothetical protein
MEFSSAALAAGSRLLPLWLMISRQRGLVGAMPTLAVGMLLGSAAHMPTASVGMAPRWLAAKQEYVTFCCERRVE